MRVTRLAVAAECLKDLQRFLRKDDRDTRDVFFQLCEYGTVRNDVLPILTHYAASHEHVFNASACVHTPLALPRHRSPSNSRGAAPAARRHRDARSQGAHVPDHANQRHVGAHQHAGHIPPPVQGLAPRGRRAGIRISQQKGAWAPATQRRTHGRLSCLPPALRRRW